MLACVLLAGSVTYAHFGERTDSLYGFASRSDLIVIGHVEQSRRFEKKGHTTLPGAVRLRVDEVLHGTLPASSEIAIRVDGMHQPRYDDGEQVLVFAEHRDGTVRSIQSRSEKVTVRGDIDPAVAVVRRYVSILAEAAPERRLDRLKELTLELLCSPVARLHQDAVYDLSRPGLLDGRLTDRDVESIGRLALAKSSPLVVRQGITAKLGVLLGSGRKSALAPLSELAVAAANPAVRVAALQALIANGATAATPALLASIEAPDRYVRLAAVEGLGTLRIAGAVTVLAGRCDDADPAIRFAALKALYRIDDSSARLVLEKIRADASPDQQRLVAQAETQTKRK